MLVQRNWWFMNLCSIAVWPHVCCSVWDFNFLVSFFFILKCFFFQWWQFVTMQCTHLLKSVPALSHNSKLQELHSGCLYPNWESSFKQTKGKESVFGFSWSPFIGCSTSICWENFFSFCPVLINNRTGNKLSNWFFNNLNNELYYYVDSNTKYSRKNATLVLIRLRRPFFGQVQIHPDQDKFVLSCHSCAGRTAICGVILGWFGMSAL